MERRGVDLPHLLLACLASESRSVEGETVPLGLILRIRIGTFLWVFDPWQTRLREIRSCTSGDEPAAQRRAAEQFHGAGVAGEVHATVGA